MEQSPTNQPKKDLSSSKKDEPKNKAVIHFPKSKKATLSSVKRGMMKGPGVFKKMKPILLAVLISIIFARVVMSVFDTEVPEQSALVGQSEPGGQEVGNTVAATKIPALSMWVVQAGVFKEVASAEMSYRDLAAKMPTIQTLHEGMFAIWVGVTSNEAAAKAIATQNSTEETPLYVKQVTRPPVDMELAEKDATWIKEVNDFVLAQWETSEPLAVPEELITNPPHNEKLNSTFTSLETLQKAGVQPGVERDTAFLLVVEGIWELSQN
ncbi:hypothetical protein [Jeotgalibacillus marinus]|uniref:SPOR domain-containing protein n=1 Tax=Jeotgalibacillus marinus TaxID=86667 RepID=A0ABV3PZT0_9BACL